MAQPESSADAERLVNELSELVAVLAAQPAQQAALNDEQRSQELEDRLASLEATSARNASGSGVDRLHELWQKHPFLAGFLGADLIGRFGGRR
jgi:hypothetical protein